MKDSGLQFIRKAIKKGAEISVYSEGELDLKRSKSSKAVWEAFNATGMSELILRKAGTNEKLGWALLIDHDEPEITLSDYSDNDFCNECAA